MLISTMEGSGVKKNEEDPDRHLRGRSPARFTAKEARGEESVTACSCVNIPLRKGGRDTGIYVHTRVLCGRHM